MRKFIYLVLPILFVDLFNLNAQITIYNEFPTQKQLEEKVTTYDSLSNWSLIDLPESSTESELLTRARNICNQWIGQQVYIMPFPKMSARGGISEKLKGNYYWVDRFEFSTCNGFFKRFRLDKVTVYLRDEKGKIFKYEDQWLDGYALLVGYYEKLKQRYIGKTFIYTGRAYGRGSQFIVEPYLDHLAIDLTTQEKINLFADSAWVCKDIQLVEENRYMHLYAFFVNDNRLIKVRIDNIHFKGEKHTFFSCFMEESAYEKWVDSLCQRYGNEYCHLIIQKKVKIGMTQDMCIDSWGEPDDINRTTTNSDVSEQWVYDKRGLYLYFTNGILTAIQD